MSTVEAPPVNAAVEDLRSRLGGVAPLSGDPGLDDVRKVYNAMHGGQPALTVRCAGAVDHDVTFAREHG